jgi:hypothetical protein
MYVRVCVCVFVCLPVILLVSLFKLKYELLLTHCIQRDMFEDLMISVIFNYLN